MPVIQTDNLTKSYGKSRGIIDLNLTVEQGEFFGFIGPNGSGKSTTIRILLGLISPTSGNAEVLGEPVSRSGRYLDDIGYMSSEAIFYEGMRVSELIAFSAKLRKKDCGEEARYLCRRLDLDPRKRIEELSLGNRKKVAVVCAMQHKPKLYIMDEPTSGLDPLIQKEFFSLLKERISEGATVFFSSHVLSEIQHNCTSAAIIQNGRITVSDSIKNLSETKAKRVSLRGITALPEEICAKSVTASEDSVNFLYNGDIKALISVINTLPVTDMTITEPELEEIFLHYYEEEGK